MGDVCSATERLPTSALLSAGLEKRGNIAVASGGFTDVWRGEYYAIQVAIKALRIYAAQNLKEAKEVSIHPVPEVLIHSISRMEIITIPSFVFPIRYRSSQLVLFGRVERSLFQAETGPGVRRLGCG